jgi:hypothetical protein
MTSTKALVIVLLVCAAPAWAQESRNAKKIQELNRAAMEDYDLLEFDAAKKQLNDALALAKRARLEKNAVNARTHLNLGIVYGAGAGDNDTALLEFIAALQIDPNLKLDPAYRSPALEKVFTQARATVGGRGGGEIGPAPGEEKGLKHTPIDEAPSGQPILVTARVGGLKAAQITLSFRGANADGFTTVNMKSPDGVEYQGTIPEGATRGDTVHYYLEARSGSGKLLAAAGNADSPNVVTIVRPKRVAAETSDEENPVRKHEPAAEGDDTTTVEREAAAPKKTMWFGVSIGAGGGYINGETEVSHQAVTCCFAPAPFHIEPEVGFWLSRRLTLSIYGRLGFPLGANVEGAATLAPAGLVRVAYTFGDNGGIYVHGDMGAGFIRHIVKLSATSATAAQGDTDTFATGPLLVGGGAGWKKPLGGTVAFQIDLNLLAGIPVIGTVGSGTRPTKLGFAVNGDLSLGFSVGF